MRKFALAALPLSLAASSAFAVVDVSAITDAVTEAGTAGATIGAAVLVMLVGIKLFKWVRRAL